MTNKVRTNTRSRSKNKLHFDVDAGLLFQLGERLVARPSIALAELIKNAYDADATKVTVVFEGVTKKGGSIVVEDNGTGMAFEDIERTWMRIAQNEKSQKLTSTRFCRPLTGAKGIGRFAARRLSNKLRLVAIGETGEGKREITQVVFDWGSFVAGTSLSSIPVTYTREFVDQTRPTGVTLYLESLRDTWSEEDIKELQQDLLSLTSLPVDLPEAVADTSKLIVRIAGRKRSGCDEDPGFCIDFHSDEFPNLAIGLSQRFLTSAWGQLTGYVDGVGRAHYELSIRGSDEVEKFTVSNRTKGRDAENGEKSSDPADERAVNGFDRIKGASLNIYYIVYRSDLFKGSNIPLRTASKYGAENGGVRLYLDNFRVFPYGDPGDDWLQLDKIRASRRTSPEGIDEFHLVQDLVGNLNRPLLLVPGNNQLFGAVYISQAEHPDIQLTVNRERLLENEAFEQLHQFVRTGIFWMTVQYAKRLAAQRQEEARLREPTVASSLERLHTSIADIEGLDPAVKVELLERVNLAKIAAEHQQQQFISQVSMLRILASAGTTVIIFGHQLRALVNDLVHIYTSLRNLRDRLPEEVLAEYDGLTTQLDQWRETVEDQARQIGFLIGTDYRRVRRELLIHEVVEAVIRPLRGYARRYDIEIENHVPRHLRTPPMFAAELHAVLINLLTNALKAVRAQSLRRIGFNGTRVRNGVTIRISDTGTGIEPAQRKRVFEPFVTTSDPDPILGVGTGLGLTVVQDILRVYGGTAEFLDPAPPWKTTMELFLPEEV